MGDGASSSGSRGGGGSRTGVKAETLVSDIGRRKGPCGYCKSPGITSISHGLWAHSITVDDYQDLLDRGWRRSGAYIYKPEMERTCCPSYTIRLKAVDFVPSKEQVHVLKRMQRFLDGTLNLKGSDQSRDETFYMKPVPSRVNCASTEMVSVSQIKGDITREGEYEHYLSKRIDDAVNACIMVGDFPSVELPKAVIKMFKPQAKRKLVHISEQPLYTSNIAFQIGAVLRRYQTAGGSDCQSDVSQNGSSQSGDSSDHSPSIVAEKLANILNLQEELSGMAVSACNGHLNFYYARKQADSEVVTSSATALVQSSKYHGGNGKCSLMAVEDSAQAYKKRRLKIHMKRSSFDPEEYELYRRYQIAVHKDKPDEVTETQYKRFLVDSPLVFVPPHSKNRTVPPCGFGSFHQQYRIDGKLVAVGVVDILPRCLSSKYLFWDPDLAFLSLGKYSALKEIDWVKDTVANCPSLQFYYLGYYIHSCSKMRYKAAYRPSELLCPLRYEWVPFTIARPILDKKAYVILSDYASLQNGSSLPFQFHENSNQPSFHDADHGGPDQSPNDESGEMTMNFEGQESEPDEESDSEISDVLLNNEYMTVDVSNITLDLDGSRVKFKDLQRIFGSTVPKKNMDSLELQLRRYARVVGTELADGIVYTLI